MYSYIQYIFNYFSFAVVVAVAAGQLLLLLLLLLPIDWDLFVWLSSGVRFGSGNEVDFYDEHATAGH